MMRIARGLVGSIIIVASLTGPAFAQTYPPGGQVIEVSDSTVLPCESITVTGSGYTPGETITVTLDGVAIGTTTVAADGTFSISVAIPCSTSPGTHVLSAGAATTEITVLAAGIPSGGAGTGADISAALIVMVGLLLLGVVAIAVTRRRRAAEDVGSPV